MNKIPTLFKRNYETDRLVRNEVIEGCEWVIADEGIATIKIDGTCCMIQNGVFYKRYDAKNGKQPPNWIPAQPEPDPVTGSHPGWIPVGQGPADQWHREAWELSIEKSDGTYELIDHKVQSNPYGLGKHLLISHDAIGLHFEPSPRHFEGIRDYLQSHIIEGIVWHHPDGRMVKIKRRDFGFKWPDCLAPKVIADE